MKKIAFLITLGIAAICLLSFQPLTLSPEIAAAKAWYGTGFK